MALAIALPLLATGYYIVLSLSSTEPDYPKLCAIADLLIGRFCLLAALPLGGAEMCDCGSAESLYSLMLHAGMTLNVAITVLIIYLGFVWVPDLRSQFATHLAEQHAPRFGIRHVFMLIAAGGVFYILLALIMPQALATAEGTSRVRLMVWAGAFFGAANLLVGSLTLRFAMWLADRLAWLQGRR